MPVPEIAAVDPDNDRLPRDRRLASGWTTFHQARRLTAKGSVVPVGDLVQVLADGFGVGRVGHRQNVPEQSGGHAEGDQRGPAALQIQQLRRGVFS